MEAKRAHEIMIPLDQYPHVSHKAALREVVEVMERSQLNVGGRNSLPRIVLVFDSEGKLVGQVRRRDILRGLEPDFLSSKPMQYRKKLFDVKVDPNLAELSYDHVLEGLGKRAERPVSDVMLPVVETVDFNDHIVKVIYELVDNNLSLLPVVKEGKVVGVVRSVDVLHEVAQLLL
ncbi:MAG: CBS domain-containing protein [Candidatus Abyssobacteria bacterium SURF_5]|uniref:CBS domain-containing protein n=1 Tax=Abyssobacteria bacterium (strain SURF_5) TaxID=2093360 RepID=A0A3A4NGN0_ABYX5|nr:MAG: CBS domain-containing protein [Candidatus Abyssubacteria bacterium SURF_5]